MAESQARHSMAGPKGGMVLANSDSNKKVIVEFVKALGRKLLEGSLRDIMRISRPASISYPRTYLQAIATEFTNIQMIENASAESDPVKRLQWVTAFVLSYLYKNIEECQSSGPLNPVLGETFLARKENGTTMFAEQVWHHPPISSWQVYGKGFILNGNGVLAAGLAGPNSLKATRTGGNRITFDDETYVEWTNPEVLISGLLYGERNVNFVGAWAISYPAHNMVCDVQFNPKGAKKGWSIGKWFNKTKVEPTDRLQVIISSLNLDEEKMEIVQGHGSWLENLTFEDNTIWTITDPVEPWQEINNLPSDSMHRGDLQHLARGQIEAAQVQKDRIENLQRHDRAVRADYAATANN